MAQQVLVLNATYEPINVCSLQRAVVLVLKNKAEVLERAVKQAAQRDHGPRVPARDPARLLRAGAAPRGAEDLAPRRLRARRLPVPVLRLGLTPHHGPPGPPLAAAAARRGTTSSPPAPRATCARATGSLARSACTPARSPARRGPTSSSRSRPRGSRSPGSRTSRPPEPPAAGPAPAANPPRVTVVKISSGPLRGVSLRVTERRLSARLRTARRRRRACRSSSASAAPPEAAGGMIEPIEGLPEPVVGLRVSGKVTQEDYERVLLPAVRAMPRRPRSHPAPVRPRPRLRRVLGRRDLGGRQARRPQPARLGAHRRRDGRRLDPPPDDGLRLDDPRRGAGVPDGRPGRGHRLDHGGPPRLLRLSWARWALVAQRIEHRFPKPGVAGSTPAGGMRERSTRCGGSVRGHPRGPPWAAR